VTDVCSDALLSAHEQEIARLEALKVQRLPILQKIDRHRELVRERDELQASSQDASRLMARGNKGERRDPGKLLREEKMRKRIAKELPKVEAELKKVLEKFEDEYGRPFLVLGERYLDELYAAAAKAAPPARSKTPSVQQSTIKQAPKSAPRQRANTMHGSSVTGRAKTPTANFGASVSRNPLASSVMSTSVMSTSGMSGASTQKSPSKIPARAPLKNMPHGNNSPERRPRVEREESTMRKMPPPRAPPPKMKDLFIPPEKTATPKQSFEFSRDRTDSIVRHVPPEDPYDDRSFMSRTITSEYPRYDSAMGQHRQISQTSSTATGHTMQSGSENWETFSEQSEPEQDVDMYRYRQAMAQTKRRTPEGGYGSPRAAQGKKIRSIRSVDEVMTTEDDNGRMVRVIEGSEAGWTTEDGF
jgi:protein regulator of cytokinesis 1